MKTPELHEYRFRLLSPEIPDGTFPFARLAELLLRLQDMAYAATMYHVEGHGRFHPNAFANKQRWLKHSATLSIDGVEAGSSVVQFHAPPLLTQTLPFEREQPAEPTTAGELLIQLSDRFFGPEPDEDFGDYYLRNQVARLKVALRPRERFTWSNGSAGIIVDFDTINRFARRHSQAPAPDTDFVYAGELHSMVFNERQVKVDGPLGKASVVLPPELVETARALGGAPVTVSGTATFKPNGKLEVLHATAIEPGEKPTLESAQTLKRLLDKARPPLPLPQALPRRRHMRTIADLGEIDVFPEKLDWDEVQRFLKGPKAAGQ